MKPILKNLLLGSSLTKITHVSGFYTKSLYIPSPKKNFDALQNIEEKSLSWKHSISHPWFAANFEVHRKSKVS